MGIGFRYFRPWDFFLMASGTLSESAASMTAETPSEGELKLTFTGTLDADSTARIWSDALFTLTNTAPKRLIIDAAGVPLRG